MTLDKKDLKLIFPKIQSRASTISINPNNSNSQELLCVEKPFTRFMTQVHTVVREKVIDAEGKYIFKNCFIR